MELILSDEEYYDLFKALRFGIEQLPDLLTQRKSLLERMTALYKTSPEPCEFVITVREQELRAGVFEEKKDTKGL